MKIVYEPPIPTHDPQLYQAGIVGNNFVSGWDALDAAALVNYERDGYLVVRGGLSADEVAAARDELHAMSLADDPKCGTVAFEGSLQERLSLAIPSEATPTKGQFSLGTSGDAMPAIAPTERARFVRKFMDFTASHAALRTVAVSPKIQKTIQTLLGETGVLFQEMALLKPPGGREKPWHQDHAYFNFPLETRIVGIWVALGAVSVENGCMFVLAGGHKDGPRLHFLRRDWQLCDSELASVIQTALPMKAGDILFFDGKLPHGTPINQTDETRWALQFHYVPESAIQTDDSARLAAFGADGKDVTC
jgi:phytanoyl-CoA hydroxylase